jgi:hypothetical protein
VVVLTEVVMFQKATKKGQSARIAMFGPAGSGKTYSALLIARGLVGPGGRVAVIDTERGSASKYADVDSFDVAELDSYAPARYIEALRFAAQEGYGAIVIDSLSHAWEGEGGILDQVDQRGGRFDTWKDMTPQLRELVNMLLTFPGHVIVTLRSKTEYVVEKNDKGKSEPRKIGLAPKFKDGMEYEFDIVGEMDDSNTMRVTKSRCVKLSGRSISRPGADFARAVLEWLGEAAPLPPPQQQQRHTPPPPRQQPRQAPRLEDIRDESELRDWCAANKQALTARKNGMRLDAQRKVADAAARCGVDDMEALRWAGLADEAA